MATTDESQGFQFLNGIDAAAAITAKDVLSKSVLPEWYHSRDDNAYEFLESHEKAKEIADMCMKVSELCASK